jgi:hypothetical protein
MLSRKNLFDNPAISGIMAEGETFSVGNKMKKLAMLVIFTVALLPYPSIQFAMATEAKKAISEGNFIDLFIRGDYDVTGPATDYIKACCEDRDAAVQLLRNNGFKVFIVSDPIEVERINRIYDQTKRSWPVEDRIEFDEFISGSRGPSAWRFWDILTSYKVSLFIENGKVYRVSAQVSRTFP